MTPSIVNRDVATRLSGMVLHIEQIGIDVRQSCAHQQMLLYLETLHSEIAVTEEFLKEDRYTGPLPKAY